MNSLSADQAFADAVACASPAERAACLDAHCGGEAHESNYGEGCCGVTIR